MGTIGDGCFGTYTVDDAGKSKIEDREEDQARKLGRFE